MSDEAKIEKIAGIAYCYTCSVGDDGCNKVKHFNVPDPDNVSDDYVIRCETCGNTVLLKPCLR
mgnify:CR=1 FL=1|jgi:DNA-directed RNA polymerase subunit RPC12/RpoP